MSVVKQTGNGLFSDFGQPVIEGNVITFGSFGQPITYAAGKRKFDYAEINLALAPIGNWNVTLNGASYPNQVNENHLLTTAVGYGIDIVESSGGPWSQSVEVEVAELLGDFNNDGTVSAADYTTWRNNEQRTMEEYQVWKDEYGRSMLTVGILSKTGPLFSVISSHYLILEYLPPVAVVIPEPSSQDLAFMGLCVMILLMAYTSTLRFRK